MLERFMEPSTYKGLTVLIGAVTGFFNPALVEPVALVCAAIYGVIDVLRKETSI